MLRATEGERQLIVFNYPDTEMAWFNRIASALLRQLVEPLPRSEICRDIMGPM
jgi:hypothetical protein